MTIGSPARPRGRSAAGRLLAATLLAGALGAGCASPQSDVAQPAAARSAVPAAAATVAPSASVIAPPEVGGRATVAPTGGLVLTLTGRVGTTNVGRTLRFDAAGLDRMGLLKVEVYEPWVKQNLTFQGTWLTDVLNVARIDPAARSLHITALDDYQVDLTTADVAAGGIFLATKRGDGTPIPVEDGGPTRIIYVGGVASGASPDQWIWSLKTIDVR